MAEEKRWLYDLVSDLAKYEAIALAGQAKHCKGDVINAVADHQLTKLELLILDLLSQAKFTQEAKPMVQTRLRNTKDSLLRVKDRIPKHLNARIEALITVINKLIARLQE